MPTGAPALVAVVTGASGWLGQNLVRALARSRERVRCLVPEPADAPPLELVSPGVVQKAERPVTFNTQPFHVSFRKSTPKMVKPAKSAFQSPVRLASLISRVYT